jgi:hypothetical protein
MSTIRRLVLDVLTPHEPPSIELAEALAEESGIAGVNVTLVEIDKEVENVKVTVEGEAIDYDSVRSLVREFGGTIHSVDEVACGQTLVEAGETPQDG